MRKSKFLICALLVLVLIIAIPAAIFANDMPSDTGNVPEYGGNIYNEGNTNISGGIVYGGVARYGGNLFNAQTGVLNVSGNAKILDGIAYVLGSNVYTTYGSTFNKGGLIGNTGSNDDGIYSSEHSTCICGSKTNKHAVGCDGEYMSIDWKPWSNPNALPDESGYWYLIGNVTVTNSITPTKGQNIYLDLNGKTINRTAGDTLYNLNSTTPNNNLTILDSAGEGKIMLGSATATGSFIRVDNENSFTLYGGTINGENVKYTNTGTPGAVIRVGAVNQKGTVNIHGGTIIGGNAVNFGGGAVGMSGGTLNMTAGEITGGTAKFGGNIYMCAGSSVNLSGTAAVTKGTATADGYGSSGNIYVEEGATLSDKNSTENVYIEGNTLYVGYGKACISPTTDVMTGEEKLGPVEEDIYAISVYMKDDCGSEYLHVVLDLSWGGLNNSKKNGIGDLVRQIAEAYGFTEGNVTVGGTHTHSSVSYGSQDEATLAWRQNELVNGVKASIEAAMKDCAPATMYIGRTETEDLTFVRRYTTNDSRYNGYWDGFNAIDSKVPTDLKHETEADEEIQLVKFERENAKPILMVNWQTHATKADGNNFISPDFIGTLRNDVATALGVNCVFYQGACGNLVPTSRITKENYKVAMDSKQEAAEKLGSLVADYVEVAYRSNNCFTKVNTGRIQIKQIDTTATSSKAELNATLIANAEAVLSYYKSYSGTSAEKLYAANVKAFELGLQSYHQAKAIEANSGIQKNYPYELNIISIGDVSFVTLPVELGDVTGKQIKEGTPYKMTLLLGYTCGSGEYVMHDAAYENGGYETYKTYFVRGTAEIMRDQYLEQLNAFYASRY